MVMIKRAHGRIQECMGKDANGKVKRTVMASPEDEEDVVEEAGNQNVSDEEEGE